MFMSLIMMHYIQPDQKNMAVLFWYILKGNNVYATVQ